MSEPFVTVSKEDAIGFVTLNRPPANSYNAEFMQHLNAAIDQVRGDDGIKVVIVQSALERFFSAGADVKAFSSNSPAVNTEMVRYAHEVLVRIGRTPKIFIAAINGHALGGGLEIALACDLRFAGDGKFQLGLTRGHPGAAAWQRWNPAPASVDRQGESAGPDDHRSHRRTAGGPGTGHCGSRVRADELMSETRAYAEKLANGATYAIGLIKLAVNEGMGPQT